MKIIYSVIFLAMMLISSAVHATPWQQDNCFLLGLREGKTDPGFLCFDPAISPSEERVKVGFRFKFSLYGSMNQPLGVIQASVTEVDQPHLLGKWVVIQGANAEHRVWLSLGPGYPPVFNGGRLTNLHDGFVQRVIRYVWEPAPLPPTPGNCPSGLHCK